jgi:hypothetical protein
MTGHASDLSLYGCRVKSSIFLPSGSKFRIGIAHGGAHFVALSRVIDVRPPSSLGIAFTHIEPADQWTLEKWISEL